MEQELEKQLKLYYKEAMGINPSSLYSFEAHIYSLRSALEIMDKMDLDIVEFIKGTGIKRHFLFIAIMCYRNIFTREHRNKVFRHVSEIVIDWNVKEAIKTFAYNMPLRSTMREYDPPKSILRTLSDLYLSNISFYDYPKEGEESLDSLESDFMCLIRMEENSNQISIQDVVIAPAFINNVVLDSINPLKSLTFMESFIENIHKGELNAEKMVTFIRKVIVALSLQTYFTDIIKKINRSKTPNKLLVEFIMNYNRMEMMINEFETKI